MSEWTPGPWRVSKKNPRRVAADHRMITTIYHSNNGLGATPAQAVELTMALADARLIAAAPDLYEALEEALANIEAREEALAGEEAFVERARAAIAKARGETK